MQTEKVIDHIVNWLKNYALNAKVNGFVLGISGGVDSAVVSTLCAKTGLTTHCMEMPIYQASGEVDRAGEHIQFLKENFNNIAHTEIDLTPTFQTFKDSMDIINTDSLVELTLANTRARLRMTTLYFFAGVNKYLVAGTGNKIEDFGVGFFTKYGDGGVDISPIGDLMKSEVYKIAKALNLPSSIVKAVPTDGLFGDNRTDEDQLGANYDELEWAMKVDEGKIHQTEFTDCEAEVLRIYRNLNRINQHKVKPIPICKIPEELLS